MKKLQYIIEENYSGMTLERYLRQVLNFTKAQIKSLKFRTEGLMINGNRVRVNYILKGNEELVLQLEEEKGSVHLLPVEGELEILYEDADLIAIWKESGMVVHPSHGHYQDTLSNRLHDYFLKRGEQVTIRSIGRLDRDTSGILVFAKNQVAAARLWKQKDEGMFWKEYLAVCQGKFKEPASNHWYTIDEPIGKADGELMKMCVKEDGLRAVTHYQVIRQNEEDFLAKVRIETGRTHQIRVHMAYMGWPLVGDVLYNRKDSCIASVLAEVPLQLCAWKVQLRQPFTGEWIQLDAETNRNSLDRINRLK